VQRVIALGRWLDDQCAKLSRTGYRVWFGFGAGAILMMIAWFAPLDRLIPAGIGDGQNVQPVSSRAAQPIATGASGLPLPRFVSLKAARANVRVGPSRQHDVAWTFNQSGMPVEIVAEFENWRRIRDSGGNEGWVYHALLSGERTGLYDPWQSSNPGVLRAQPKRTASIAAHVENRAVLKVSQCDGTWCAVSAGRAEGYVEQSRLWGVYPGEQVD
jgi:SH3-like domain-containing protein